MDWVSNSRQSTDDSAPGTAPARGQEEGRGSGERSGAGEGEPWGRGKRLPWGGIVFALNQKNFNQSCNIEATLEKALRAVISPGKPGGCSSLYQSVEILFILGR